MTDAQTVVGVVAESGADERRVALVPKAVASLVNAACRLWWSRVRVWGRCCLMSCTGRPVPVLGMRGRLMWW